MRSSVASRIKLGIVLILVVLIAVLGMTVGAAFCHNFGLASSADGPTANGKIAVIICLVVVAIIGLANIQKQKD